MQVDLRHVTHDIVYSSVVSATSEDLWFLAVDGVAMTLISDVDTPVYFAVIAEENA